MSDTSIRLSDAAKKRLDIYKREGESYNDAIIRLTSKDRWAGFGIAAGDSSDARDGVDEIRSSMRRQMERDIEEMSG